MHLVETPGLESFDDSRDFRAFRRFVKPDAENVSGSIFVQQEWVCSLGLEVMRDVFLKV